ncbi:hypothetical protein COB52_04715 [Candidatus Kaiserbacteria bacterium]|nr:MAG: hypothetical protein COB52_04715 [Candidatus Kaiserbacteria bacterium]
MKLVNIYIIAVATLLVLPASALNVYNTNGFRVYCANDNDIGKTGFAIKNVELNDMNDGKLELSANAVKATCMEDFTWTEGLPGANYSYRVYDPETCGFMNVDVTSKKLKIHAINPANSHSAGNSLLNEDGSLQEKIQFDISDYLIESQKDDIESTPIETHIWLLMNGIHTFTVSNGIVVGPARYSSAELFLPVVISKVDGKYKVSVRP